MKKLLLSFFVLVVFIFATNKLYGAEISSAQSGPWDSTWTWVGGVIPTSVDNVTITAGHTVEIIVSGSSKTCNNLTIQSGAKLYGNAVATTSKFLRVYGTTMTVDGTYGGTNDALGFSLYGASGQTLTITGGGTFKANRVQQNAGGDHIIFDMDAEVHYAGSGGTGGSGLYPSSGNLTVTVNAGKTLTMANNSYLSTNTSSGDAAGSNSLTINVYGTITCSGANSKFNLNVIAGKTGSLTIYNGGKVNLFSYLRGNATNLGTVNVAIINGGQLNGFSGSFFDLSTATTTVNGMVDFGLSSTATRSIGTATVGSTGILAFQDGTYPTGTITLGAGSEVTYYGSSAIILGTTPTAYSYLRINNSGGVALGTSVAVNNALTLMNGLLTLGSNNLTLGPSATIAGSPSVSNMVVADGSGQLIKQFSDGVEATHNFTFPVGDNTGTAEYSPVTLDFTSGSFSSASAGVKLVNSQHPNPLLPPVDYINRFWTVSQSGISSFSCDTKFKYVDADIVGTESNLYTLKYDNPNWVPFGLVNTATNELSATVTSFSDFWAANEGAGPVELTSFSASVKNSVVQLTWKTATEINSLKFDVQRKSGNSEWVKIGEVIAAGNSNSDKNYSFSDKAASGKYQYRIKMIDVDGSYEYSSVVEAEVVQPGEFRLSQNYPNPFNPSTTIDYALASDSRVTLELYSLIGEKVAELVNKEQASGYYSYHLNTNGMNLTTGVYLYKLTAVSKTNEIFSQSKKLLLIK